MNIIKFDISRSPTTLFSIEPKCRCTNSTSPMTHPFSTNINKTSNKTLFNLKEKTKEFRLNKIEVETNQLKHQLEKHKSIHSMYQTKRQIVFSIHHVVVLEYFDVEYDFSLNLLTSRLFRNFRNVFEQHMSHQLLDFKRKVFFFFLLYFRETNHYRSMDLHLD